jgi:hypothetical protein
LPGDACAVGIAVANVAPANHVATVMKNFMTCSGRVAATKPVMIEPARLLAPRVKIKVHLRATRKSGAQSAISGKAQDSLGSASQIRLRFIRTKQIKTAITPTPMSIQYWPSKPRKEKCSIRNCNVPAPP